VAPEGRFALLPSFPRVVISADSRHFWLRPARLTGELATGSPDARGGMSRRLASRGDGSQVRAKLPSCRRVRGSDGGIVMRAHRSSLIAVLTALAACSHSSTSSDGGPGDGGSSGLERIKHVVIIMQENRSFDHYFGTFPGADGIPMDDAGV